MVVSIIEKALNRISTGSSGTESAKDHLAARYNNRPASRNVNHRKSLEQALANAESVLTLDHALLQDARIIAVGDEVSRVNDEFRRIKRPLLANVAGRSAHPVEHANIIMITSSVAGEGKTHTSINLALNIAREVDYTVLLVDADVIKRQTSELLGIAKQPGLVDLLHDDRLKVGDVMLRTDVPRLAIMPAGECHPQAAELLSSHEMQRVVDELSSRYPERIIIFDSPPLLATSEAQVLAELMGQIVLVVEAGRTSPRMVEEAVAVLHKSKPIGLVLNKSRQKMTSDYYGGYYK